MGKDIEILLIILTFVGAVQEDAGSEDGRICRNHADRVWPTILAALILMLTIDIVLHLISGVELRSLPLLLAWTSKLLGGWLGGRHGLRRAAG